ncbi:MAG: SDR family NAD(P)-dependent oxidoreductase [Chitinophagales bacterium]|nr:SDR family NAD(P)-dependent oxidoreductase [Chitinophagales bacterium]
MYKTIFITGATSGFGKATAEKFAKENYRIIITGRRVERLKAVSDELKKNFNAEVFTLEFDVRNKVVVEAAINSLPEKWKQVDILVNNAGLASGFDFIQEGNTDDWDVMIDTNLKGLLYVTRAVSPMMVERKQGHIFNIGSTAGKVVYERGNVYCATKFAVDALSQSMRIDMLKHNIKVTAIHPGAAETEFSLVRFKGDEEKAKQAYKGYQPLAAEDIANTVYYCATLPPHVCINDLVITSTAQASAIYFNKQL